MSRSPSLHSRLTNTARARFYEGGKRTAANRDFYNATSEFENTATPDRDTMRARARWLHENNPIMANIDDTIVNNTIGTGIRYQAKTGKAKIDTELEQRFAEWARTCDIAGRLTFYDMQRIILSSRMVDGEILIHKIMTAEGLKLQLIEVDALDVSKGKAGIEYDDFGKPERYHFYTNRKSISVESDRIINYFKAVRPTQLRGVSEYKQSIIDIKNFAAFQSATIQGARARSNVAFAIESDRNAEIFNPKLRDTSDPQDGDIIDVNGLMVYYLRSGEDIKSLDSQNGGDNYGEFVSSAVRLMSVGRQISYELAFRDYSQVNFASSRASLIQDNKRFDHEQAHLSEYVLDNIFREWIDIEVMSGRVASIRRAQYMKDPMQYTSHRWSYPRREWVDPVKDLTAVQMEIDMGITTNTDACAAKGQDYEENLRTKRRELELKKEILGDYYQEVVATEQQNKDLLISVLSGETNNMEVKA